MIKKCSICDKEFETKYVNKNICSFQCRQEKARRNSRESMRRRRHLSNHFKPCQICGYQETTDIHHEGEKIYILCPNHHALITRNIKNIKDLLITC